MSKVESMVSILLCVGSLLFSSALFGQQSGCNEPEFRAFDFWLGTWEVSDNLTGNLAGRNTITQMEGGCMLLESWQGAAGSTGTSVNYYNPVLQQWRQLWISAGRYSIDISGDLSDGSMQLVGHIYPFAGAAARFRGTWTPNPDGSVRQFFEQYNEATENWDVWFDGRYVLSEN